VRGPVTVAVPATSANLGPGFDALGIALELTDEVTAEVTGEVTASGIRPGSDPRVAVEVTGEGAGEVGTGADHLVVKTILTAFRQLGAPEPPGLRLTCLNRIPHARGLGSSSAAIVAGVLLARALVGVPPDPAADLALAAALEGHPDNVAPCLLGGFTIAWTAADAPARAVRLNPSPAVRPVLYVPSSQGLTAHARAALPERVPHGDAVFNLARTGLLVHALTADPSLLLVATEDRLHQPYRAAGMPATAELVATLRAAGVPAMVSGAGPSVLALTGAFAAEPPPPPAGWMVRALTWSAAGGRMLDVEHADDDPVAAGRVG
jgi:homoserine kinase